jgi:hypothetical protein
MELVIITPLNSEMANRGTTGKKQEQFGQLLGTTPKPIPAGRVPYRRSQAGLHTTRTTHTQSHSSQATPRNHRRAMPCVRRPCDVCLADVCGLCLSRRKLQLLNWRSRASCQDHPSSYLLWRTGSFYAHHCLTRTATPATLVDSRSADESCWNHGKIDGGWVDIRSVW